MPLQITKASMPRLWAAPGLIGPGTLAMAGLPNSACTAPSIRPAGNTVVVGHLRRSRIDDDPLKGKLLLSWPFPDDSPAQWLTGVDMSTDSVWLFPMDRVLPVIERDDVVVIGGDDDGSMRTAPLGVLSGAVVVSVTGSSPR